MKIDTNHFNTLERMRKAKPEHRVDIAVDFITGVFHECVKYQHRMSGHQITTTLGRMRKSWDKLCSHELAVTECGEYVLDELMASETLVHTILSSENGNDDAWDESLMYIEAVFIHLGWDTTPIQSWVTEHRPDIKLN